MANENVNNAESNVTENQQEVNQHDNNTPTVKELMEQLKQANADRDKYKSANDKLSKEAAESKRALRAKQTAEEQEAEAKAEAQRLAEEEKEALRKENSRFKAMAAYKNLDEKTVDMLLEAVSESDHNAIANIMERYAETRVKTEKAEWLKSRPPVNAGGQYSSMTKEQIMAIKDNSERMKAIAQNQHLFNQRR